MHLGAIFAGILAEILKLEKELLWLKLRLKAQKK